MVRTKYEVTKMNHLESYSVPRDSPDLTTTPNSGQGSIKSLLPYGGSACANFARQRKKEKVSVRRRLVHIPHTRDREPSPIIA